MAGAALAGAVLVVAVVVAGTTFVAVVFAGAAVFAGAFFAGAFTAAGAAFAGAGFAATTLAGAALVAGAFFAGAALVAGALSAAFLVVAVAPVLLGAALVLGGTNEPLAGRTLTHHGHPGVRGEAVRKGHTGATLSHASGIPLARGMPPSWRRRVLSGLAPRPWLPA